MERNGAGKKKRPERIDCRRCVSFYVTWQRSFPYGCRAFGFKSKHLPSYEVFLSSGDPCCLFVKKGV